MHRNTIVFATSLFLLSILSGCAAREVSSPPQIIEVTKYLPIPVACRRLRAVVLPEGSTGQDTIEEQNRVIREYELQIETCAKENADAHP